MVRDGLAVDADPLARSACRSLTMSSTTRSIATASSGSEATVRPPGTPGISVRVCGSQVVHGQRHASATSRSTTTPNRGRVEHRRLHVNQRASVAGSRPAPGADHADAPHVDLDRDRPVDVVLLAQRVDLERRHRRARAGCRSR